jgi:Prp8 binding protein
MERREENDNQLINVEQTSSEVMVHESNNINTRSSGLQAPTMLLSGHEGAVFSLSFDPTGKNLASGSMDRNICK